MKSTSRTNLSQQVNENAIKAGVPSVRSDTRNWFVQVCLVALVVFLLPKMLIPNAYMQGVATLLFIYIILSISFQTLFGQAGLVSFGHSAMFGLGAYFSTFFVTKYQVSYPLAWGAALLAVLIIAVFVGSVILRLGMLFLAVVTLSLCKATILIISQLTVLGGDDGLSVPLAVEDVSDRHIFNYFLAGIPMCLVLAVALALRSTRIGREIKAIGDDPVASACCGIPVGRRRIQVFALSSGLAAFAGMIFAQTNAFISPSSFDIGSGILILAMVAIGGLKSVWGAVAGATFLIILPEVAAPLQELNQLVYGLVLILVFRFAPHGIMGIIESIRHGVSRIEEKRKTSTLSTKGSKDL